MTDQTIGARIVNAAIRAVSDPSAHDILTSMHDEGMKQRPQIDCRDDGAAADMFFDFVRDNANWKP